MYHYPRAEIQSYLGVGNGDNSSATFSSKERPSTIAAYYERELTMPTVGSLKPVVLVNS